MTTIAYANGIIASDSQVTSGETIYSRMPKIHRLSSGGLMGFAGACDHRDMVALFDKVKQTRHLPTRKAILDIQCDTDGLFIMPNGMVYYVECMHRKGVWEGGLYPASEKFAACGSGGKFALVAIECGKNAVEAIHLACRRDTNSCPPVHQLSLGLRKIVPSRSKQAPRRRR